MTPPPASFQTGVEGSVGADTASVRHLSKLLVFHYITLPEMRKASLEKGKYLLSGDTPAVMQGSCLCKQAQPVPSSSHNWPTSHLDRWGTNEGRRCPGVGAGWGLGNQVFCLSKPTPKQVPWGKEMNLKRLFGRFAHIRSLFVNCLEKKTV